MSDSVISASSVQHGVWVTEQAGVAGRAYAMPLVVWFEGDLDAAALAAACADVQSRHELLRAAWSVDEGVLVGHVADQVTPLRQLEVADLAPAVDECVLAELAAGFDLDRPLLRLTLLQAGRRSALVVLVHHLVFDGSSKDVFVTDLSLAYNARVEGVGTNLLPLTTTVRAAVEGQQRLLQEQQGPATALWSHRWCDSDAPLLPGLLRPPQPGEAGDAVSTDLAPELSSAMSTAAALLGVSRFDLLAAGVRTLLSRYGNDGAGLAVDLSTRPVGAAEHVGLFVNELPLLAPVTGDLTFATVARSVHDELRQVNPVRSVPLARAGIALSPRTSVLPVSFSYRGRVADAKFAGVDTSVDWMLFNGTARSALHVQVVDDGARVELSVQFAPAALARLDAERIAGHLTTLLGAAVRAPETPVAELPLLSTDELRLLERLNDTSVDVDLEQTVVDLFRRQAGVTPTRTAVTCRNRSLTYAELDEVTDAAAGRLRAAGVGTDVVVALRMSRSIDLLVAMLAVLKAGGAYLPLDPTFPPDRTAFILEDADAALVLIDGATSPGTTTIAVGELTAPGERPTDLAAPSAGDLAYVLYTSGSTGRPKGVEVEHRPLTNLLHAFQSLVGGSRDTWLAHTSLSFDISALELFTPLVSGGRVVLATDDQVRDGAALVNLIRDEQVSHVQATPSGWRMLLSAGFVDHQVVALVGGEALPQPLATEIRGAAGRVLNCYGPTEATVWCTVAELTDPSTAVTVGAPIANTTAYVLDHQQRPVPPGVLGELCVGGAALARGYRGRPELTADKFVRTPVGRLYRTGDLARLRSDGTLDCLGRTDNQVKLRGHRIELGEIEAALDQHPDVQQAVVVLHGEAADARLIAYIVGKRAPGPAAVDLREHLGELLPDYMIPRSYVGLDVVPLTPNGKVDRARLPEPPIATVTVDAPAEGQDDELTATVRAIFCEVLKLPSIGLADDLFDLGGHSLTITQIMARIRSVLDADVPLDVFFDTPTVSGVVAAISVGD